MIDDTTFRAEPGVAPQAPARSMNRRRLYFCLLVSWLALTITLTSLPNPSFRIDVSHPDKIAHVAFYGVIGFLFALWRRESGDSATRALVGALLFVAAFGAFDEIHQRFIPGRSMDILDWTADAAGGMAGGTTAGLLAQRDRIKLS